MYAAPFDYFRASSLDEAHQLLQKHPGAKLLAGGHSLIPLLKMRLTSPSALVDIGRIKELRGITSKDGTIRIGALTTHAEVASSDVLKTSCPMLADAASQIGDPQVRNCGTVGGNVAHADPASDLPTVFTALEAKFTAVGPKGTRTIPAADFFQGMMTTALDEREILTSVEFAARRPGDGTAYEKFTHPASRYAVVGAAAVVSVKGGVCSSARVAVGGLLPAAMRLPSVEAALAGARASADTAVKASELVSKHLGGDVLEDVYASGDYRRAMAVVFVKRALTTAFDRATRAA
ncbi:MAG TPA: xanthine dehydrogenase family protein subunit M [Vicinamibacterales bacterium]